MTAIDTSVVVAALLAAHEHHDRALAALSDALATPPVIVPLPAMIESYSVLTRLPAGYRVPPAEALKMLEHTFGGRTSTPELPAKALWPMLREAAAGGVAGGSVHDAHIATCARRAGATRILTLNARHFRRLAPDLEISVP